MATNHKSAPQPGDGWVNCSCGRRHWGLNGAAGIALFSLDDRYRPAAVLLQHRALWSHQGGTWGIPGGAIATGENARQGALREAYEEAGIAAADIRIVGTVVLDHRTWSYTTQIAIPATHTRPDFDAHDDESIELRWVEIDRLNGYPLLTAFGEQWPIYVAALRRGLARIQLGSGPVTVAQERPPR